MRTEKQGLVLPLTSSVANFLTSDPPVLPSGRIFQNQAETLFRSALQSFPGGSEVKSRLADAGDACSIPGSGRSPGGGNGNPLQYSCLGNPMDGGAWRVTIYGVTKESDAT